MSMLPTPKIKKYTDGRTKQSFKDETNINKIIQRAQKTGTISHLAKYQGVYADYANFDYFETQLKLTRGRQMFDELPSEIRNEFQNSPAGFFKYVNDPANSERLGELLPALAKPGKQNISVSTLVKADAAKAAIAAEQPIPASEPPAADNTPPVAPNESTEPPPAS